MVGLIDKICDRIVDDIHDMWKWGSVQLSTLGFFVMGAAEVLGSSWSGLPPDLRDKIPHSQTLGMILFGLTIIARITKRKEKSNGSDQ